MPSFNAKGAPQNPPAVAPRSAGCAGAMDSLPQKSKLIPPYQPPRDAWSPAVAAKPSGAPLESSPTTSSFVSSERFAFRWFYSDATGTFVCVSTGAAVLNRAKRALGLAANGIWDEALQDALVADAVRGGTALDTVRATLQADRELHQISPTGIRYLLYVAFYRPAGRRYDLIRLYGSTVLPLVGVTLTGATSPDILCFLPSRDIDPTLMSQAQVSQFAGQSSTGILASGPISNPSDRGIAPISAGANGIVLVASGLTLIGIVFLLTRKL